MGRKKKRTAPDPMSRIFCYYCDRNFATEQMLLSHQREKHLRCPTCNKRMLSVASMVIHSSQMHNVTISTVPNAIQARSSVAVDVLGMKGIPDSYYAALRSETDQHPVKHQRYDMPSEYAVQQAYPMYHAQQYYPPPPQQQQQHYAAYPPYAQPQDSQYVSQYQQQPYPPQHYAQPYQTYYNQDLSTSAYQSAYPVQPPVIPPTQPSQLPAHTAALSMPETQPTATGAAPVDVPAATPSKPQPADEVKIVFTRLDVCMEELRAQLPRYRIK